MFRQLLIAITSLSVAMPGTAAVPKGFRIPTAHASGGRLASLPDIVKAEVDMTALMEAAFEVADSYDPALYLPSDVVESLDYDPDKAFEFVRDSVGFDPYVGVLRGPDAVLGARAANAYDQAMLLRHLLDDMGVDTRLAFGTLSDDEGARLLKQGLAPAPDKPALEPLAGIAGLPPQALERLSSRARRDYGWLQEALSGRSKLKAVISAAGIEDVRDHVWVQARLGSGWTDLDPSFPDAKPGEAFATAEAYATEPRSADRQGLEISVVAESLVRGALTESEVLQARLDAPATSARQVYLVFAPRSSALGSTLMSSLDAQSRFVPLLIVDGNTTRGEPLAGVT
jgi:hypothetical protein